MPSQVGDGAAAAGGNALDVVVRILNNQLSSLVWIDEKVGLNLSAESLSRFFETECKGLSLLSANSVLL